ncbi:Gfo/Idh/MocA family oxidoreductase [Paenibacillus sp.]|uniref:Gfo/Idh/MocA family protein n=1 Tax=Paenibacillus sp. TaxID=58172 RepID=UPI002D58931E|nr:Gfo/Idh/MocA family oxidoreductase [Paenibacillus sp.]HZG86418.1 Gfo/Idh/MocA family oxidoreductase [Paenibacillus sp.]
MNELRIGVIGLGGIARSHIRGILEGRYMRLAAVCDAVAGNREEVGAQYGIPTSLRFEDYRQLIACPEVDAVVIALPNHLHYEAAKTAILHRKPFLLEKPVALNAGQAKELLELQRARQVPNMVAFSYRYKSAVRYAKHLIAEGRLGNIRHVYGRYLQSWGLKDYPLVWRLSKAQSGSGALGDLGSHLLDLTRYLVGDITEVAAAAGTIRKRRKRLDGDEWGEVDVDDYCHLLAAIDGEISGSFEISRFAHGRGNYQRFEIYGEEGALIYELEAEDTLSVCLGPVYGEARTFQRIPIPDAFKAHQMRSFRDIALGASDPDSATLEDGYINQLWLDNIQRSFEERTWVRG